MHVSEQLAAYALGCLDETEAAQVAEHLASCDQCQAELQGYLEVTGCLALAARQATPEAWVKRRVIQRIEPTLRARVAPAQPAWRVALAGLFRRTAPAWGMAALALIVVLGVGNVWLWRQAHPKASGGAEMMVVAMVPVATLPTVQGRLVISSDGEYGSLVVENLPVPDEAHVYQVWLTEGSEQISGGLLAVNDHGYGVLEILAPEPLMSYGTFSVTLEPAGGSAQPTGAVVLEGSP
ncbi:MAG TPA: anti-sigma factor [Anaerolineae bacterium]|nr:anti-sigma factor [Anaerolineae bacterium]